MGPVALRGDLLHAKGVGGKGDRVRHGLRLHFLDRAQLACLGCLEGGAVLFAQGTFLHQLAGQACDTVLQVGEVEVCEADPGRDDRRDTDLQPGDAGDHEGPTGGVRTT
jgi:hypothetical protein